MQDALEKAEIFVNKNTIPYEPGSPFHPSGLRLGTPAITTRGMRENEMKEIAKGIAAVVNDYKNEKILKKVKKDILELCNKFPLYPGFDILK